MTRGSWPHGPLLIAVLCLPSVAWSDPWFVGARAGGTLTNIHGEFADALGPDSRVGFTGGLFGEFSSGGMGMALEVNYVQKGFRIDGEGTDETGAVIEEADANVRFHYLEIPLLIRVSLPTDGEVVPYLSLGPTFAFALDGRLIAGDLVQVLSEDMQPVDVGGVIGVGARIGHGTYRMALEARYSSGFQDLWDVSQNLESINRSLELTVAVVR